MEYNGLPIYDITFDPARFESGVDMIALTETPAIELMSLRFAQEEPTIRYFADAERMIVAGPAMIPNKPIYRKEDGKEFYVVFSTETIEKMAAKFNSEHREYKFNIEHNENVTVAGYVKENWIVEDPEKDKSSLYGFSLPVGSWFITAQITDRDMWGSVIKQMDQVGFSVEGLMGLTQYFNQTQKSNNEKMSKENVKRKKFFANRISTKKKFNVTSKKFEEVLISEDSEILILEDMAEGAAVEILNDDAEMVTAPDGTYEIPSEGIVIEIADGEIENIDSLAVVEETEMAEETQMAKDDEDEKDKKMYEMDPEMIAKIIELESRLEALEAKMAEAAQTEEAFEKITRFTKDVKKAERLEIIKNLLN